MKIDQKIKKEVEKLVNQFIKRHAEKDKTGKLTGENPILRVSTANLVLFIQSEELFKVSKIPIPDSLTRRSEKRDFHSRLGLMAKHYFKEKMDIKDYNAEVEHDPNVMIENYKEYIKIKEEEEWY